jgi:hypothetical protein
MPEVFKFGKSESENMEITLEVPRNGYIGLNTTSRELPPRKYIYTERDT